MKRPRKVETGGHDDFGTDYILKKSKKSNIHNKTHQNIHVVDVPADVGKEAIQFLHQFEKQNKALNNQLRQIESKYSELFECSSDAIVLLDSNLCIQQFNRRFQHITGFSGDEIENAIFTRTFLAKNDRKKIAGLIEKVRDRGSLKKQRSVELELIREDQSRLPVLLRISGTMENDCFFVMIQDNSLVKKYEMEIGQRKQELSLLALISKSMKHPKNLNKNLQVVLEHICHRLGFEQGAICLGDSRLKNLAPRALTGLNRNAAENLIDKYCDLILQVKREKSIITENPSSKSFVGFFTRQSSCRSIALIPLFIRRNVFGIIALASLKQLEFDSEKKQLLTAIGNRLASTIENSILFRELMEKTREVEIKNKELSSFVCTVSHDLKTPIIALHGFLGLFKERYAQIIDPEGEEYLDRVFRNAEYMERMINDLLKLSRAGRVVGAKRRFSTYKLVNEIVMSLSPRFQEKNVHVEISKSLPVIYGDRDRLQTVFENLIVNATKYASADRQPKIEIGCMVKQKQFQFWIKDNGIGIDPENHERIFEVFQKCKQHDDASEGTGVGLTIVKKIVSHHGGNVWVDSRLNRGAIFYFTLPKSAVKRKKMG